MSKDRISLLLCQHVLAQRNLDLGIQFSQGANGDIQEPEESFGASRPCPSALFEGIETAERRIWLVSPKFSFVGKLSVMA
ncbi:MAG: hypothetical protein PVI99_08550 [Anaerolineales bacterium]